MALSDENANGRRLDAALTFAAPPLVPSGAQDAVTRRQSHSWLPAAPFCRVTGRLTLREAHNPGAEEITFQGPATMTTTGDGCRSPRKFAIGIGRGRPWKASGPRFSTMYALGAAGRR